jgi:glutamyl-Q tRNA(Asp) synthetase
MVIVAFAPRAMRGLDRRFQVLSYTAVAVFESKDRRIVAGETGAMQPIFRFAPSPNGLLHLGHAYSALLNADEARGRGGTLLLRIEDIDPQRCRRHFETAIYEDLAWLGIAWAKPVRRQSEHIAVYRVALERLAAEGLLYRSFESRADIARVVAASADPPNWPRDPDGAPLFHGAALPRDEEARRVEAGAPYAWRLDMQKAVARSGALAVIESGDAPGLDKGVVAAHPQRWGDVILARKEVPTSYHLSVVIDDALQGVTDVVRGADLYQATAVHRLLQTLLDLPAPRYAHHALVRDEQGRKLSKSAGAPALRTLRLQGETPAGIRRMLDLPS